MKAFYDHRQRAHAPRSYLSSGALEPYPEDPERVDRLLAGARAAGCELVAAKDCGLGPIAAVHTPEYIEFLHNIHRRWSYIEGAPEDAMPNVFPRERNGRRPESAVGQLGYHTFDGSCAITKDTWESACASARTAVAATEEVMAGARVAYGLCRPPGHHAYKDSAGGFCYFNNAAIAAQHARRVTERVAILDIDLHHGNGTQDIFYDRDDVLYVSLHADPVRFYPFFWGHADERGQGAGLGYNLNLPIPRHADDAAYLGYLAKALSRIEAFAPGMLILSLGLDPSEADPFGGLCVTTDGFGKIGDRIAALGLPTVIVQEGGYLSEPLAGNLTAVFGAFRDHE